MLTNDMLTNTILGIAAVLAVIVVVLFIKKFIKVIISLILITVICFGAYFGLRVVDNRTNICTNVPTVNSAYDALMTKRSEQFGLTSVQVNYWGTDIGITVLYTVECSELNMVTETLLQDTRDILLDKDNYKAVIAAFGAEGQPPAVLRVGIKYQKLEAVCYEAKLIGDISTPDDAYGAFYKVIDTNDILTSVPELPFN